MRQSITSTNQTWMGRERAFEALLHPDRVLVEADPYAPTADTRRQRLEQVVAQARARHREPRVCLYALSFAGHEPRHSLEAVAEYAQRRCWLVEARQSYTDHDGTVAPERRPGWGRVRQQIRAGYADGVVVVTPSVISYRVDEYRQEIDWLGQHCGFIALVVPEVPRERT